MHSTAPGRMLRSKDGAADNPDNSPAGVASDIANFPRAMLAAKIICLVLLYSIVKFIAISIA